jgi:dihydrofolate reductase
MGKVILDITMSLDGFVAGPNITEANPMGDGGEQLHDWLFGSKTEKSAEIVNDIVNRSGAVIVGGRTYHIAIDGPWEGVSPFVVPAFVLTTHIPTLPREGFTFVADGIESALSKARSAAGEKDIWIMGGAQIIQQYLNAGLFDEFRLHIAPVLLGGGSKLFEGIDVNAIKLDNKGVMETPRAVHMVFVRA